MSFMSGFWHDEDFWEAFSGIHTAFITGRLGSGKTLLSFAMAHRAMQLHFSSGVYANIPHAFPRNFVRGYTVLQPGDDEVQTYGAFEPVDPLHDRMSIENAFVVIDEAWQIIDSRYSVSNFSFYGAWSRKSNTFWTFPSVYAIDKRVRAMSVERVADIAVLPIRIWVYRWASADGRRGWFGLSRPELYFGTYKTRAVPLNDGGALDLLMAWAQRVAGEGVLELVQRGNSRRREGKPASDVFTKRLEATNEKVSGVWQVVSIFGNRVDELEKRIVELEEKVDVLGSSAASGASGVVGEDANRWG